MIPLIIELLTLSSFMIIYFSCNIYRLKCRNLQMSTKAPGAFSNSAQVRVRFFKDAIVIDSFRLEIAISSPSFF